MCPAEADASVLLVSVADKLHNARSILADLRRIGDAVWDRFNASRDDTLCYHRSIVATFRANPAYSAELIGERERILAEVARLAAPGD